MYKVICREWKNLLGESLRQVTCNKLENFERITENTSNMQHTCFTDAGKLCGCVFSITTFGINTSEVRY